MHYEKVINDNIHGLINFHGLLIKVIDTPAFQRLRNISQLGLTSWVYPTATHHRFEHSIGTAHLAGKLLRHLRECQPELELTDRDILIAQMAGLLHDIGHGPFSHFWDQKFLPSVLKEPIEHEKISLKIIDHMLDENGGELRKAFAENDLDDDAVGIIKEMITGGPLEGQQLILGNSPKSFMYEVVSNQRTGVDVDKLDYLARDTHALGISLLSLTCDIGRLFYFTRVYNWNGGYRLAHRDKEVSTLMNVFQLRQRLHRVAYQHNTSVAIDMMLVEALQFANKKRQYAEKVYNIVEYLCLTDNIFWDILFSTDAGLAESRRLLQAINVRKLYRPLFKMTLRAPPPPQSDIRKAVLSQLQGYVSSSLSRACAEALRIAVCFFSFSSSAELLQELLVFDKDGVPAKWSPDCISRCGEGLGRSFQSTSSSEWEVRLYSTLSEPISRVEALKVMETLPPDCSVNNALVWAFFRWGQSVLKKDLDL